MYEAAVLINHLDFINLREKQGPEFHALLLQENMLLGFGDIFEKLQKSRRFEEFLTNKQELILSSLPLPGDKNSLKAFDQIMQSSEWSFNYPNGLVTSSIIKLETYVWHTYSCDDCKCSIHEIVNSVLSSGLRQIYTSDVTQFVDDIQNPINHPVMLEIIGTLNELKRGISIAIDGERLDVRNTGTNRVATELVSRLANCEFVTSLDVLIPLGYEVDKIELSVGIVQIGLLGGRLKNYDILFRPYQSWEISWLQKEWNKFGTHVQWWLDFISFETPDYAGGLTGITKNLNSAIWAAENFESTLFLSPSCMQKATSLGSHQSQIKNILPCTVTPQESQIDKSRDKLILLVGNSFNHKARVFTLRLFEKLIQVDPEFQLIFIGANPNFATTNKIEAQILERNNVLKSRMTDLGPISDQELFDYYRKAMFVFSPSTVEGFGLVPFEAATWGVTPLTSKLDAWNDYLCPNYWLDLYSIDQSISAILELSNSEEKRLTQISHFTNWLEDNNWDFLANRSILHFGRAIFLSKKVNYKQRRFLQKMKNFAKRTKFFPILILIKNKIRYE